METHRWTHYPIRFNRKNRMVYVFCFDGVVRSAKWDDLFFTFGRCEWLGVQEWDIRGHALKADKKTVEWTFALHGQSPDKLDLMQYWEFVRRYMEEGPASVHDDVLWCHDIATTREKTWKAGYDVLNLTYGNKFLNSLFTWPAAFVRQYVMKTGKIPVWPDEIEAQCQIDPDDPYALDASNNTGELTRADTVIC